MHHQSPSSILHQAGLRCTPRRAAIIQVLLNSRDPLTLREVERSIPGGLKLNQVNLYRALEAFLQTGIIHRVLHADRTWRFALCTCSNIGHCHPHFVCKNCGGVECLHRVKMPPFPEELPGYVVEERELYLKGLCTACAGMKEE